MSKALQGRVFIAAMLLLAVVVGAVFSQPLPAPNEQVANVKMKTESFSRDPGWIGVNSRSAQSREPATIRQDFGYSAKTGNAGGQ